VRALVVERPADAGALRLTTLPDPEPGPGQVLVAVEAVGVNPVDAQNRADPSWAGIAPPFVVGYEFAGTVRTLGNGVRDLAVGQSVWGLLPVRGTRSGAYAELLAVDQRYVRPSPAGLTAIDAAALPLAGATSLQLLDRLGLEPGAAILVHGAAGGVGSVLVQLARARQLRVAAPARAERHRLLRALGVQVVVERESPDALDALVAELGAAPDAVVDLVGHGLLGASLPYVAPGGAAASIVELRGDLEEAVDRNLTLHGVLVRADGRDLERLADEVEAGRLRPVVDEVVEFDQAERAHRRVESGHGQGKLVLRVGAPT
jgi:NADPH:quinone reductase